MTYNTQSMILPRNAIAMDAEEMRYLEGGLALSMKRAYLNKSTCKSVGKKYAGYKGLSQMRIAKEIYAHAVAYYAASITSLASRVYSLGITTKAVGMTIRAACSYIARHANPVNIGGDPAWRVTMYNAIWKL